MGFFDKFEIGKAGGLFNLSGRSIFNALLAAGMIYGIMDDALDSATPEEAKAKIDDIIDSSILLEIQPLVKDYGPAGQAGSIVLTAVANLGDRVADSLIKTEVVGEDTVITAGSKSGIVNSMAMITAGFALLDFSEVRRMIA